MRRFESSPAQFQDFQFWGLWGRPGPRRVLGVLSVIRVSRRGTRRAVIGAFVAVFCFALPPAAGAGTTSPSAIAPIVGTWHDGGAVIKVTGGGGSFQGTVISGKTGACNSGVPGMVFWKGLSGSGFSYSGQIPFVHTDDCSSAGDGPATFTLSDINSGTWTATSPDGMQYSSSFTREGTWPGADNGGANKPNTDCKKNGKKVPCPKQKAVALDIALLAKQIAKLGDQFKKANKGGKITKAITIAGKMNKKVGKVVTKVNKVVKTAEEVKKGADTFKQIWDFLHLPKKEQGPTAKKIAGNQALEFLFGKEGDKMLAQNNSLLQTADAKYASDPAIHTELDNAALIFGFGSDYGHLTPDQKLAAAHQVEGTLGKQFDYSNQAADLGIAGLKFTLTTKGAKL